MNNHLDFEVDLLTHSVQNRITGDSFPTSVIRAFKPDLKEITKKTGWKFDWKQELKYPERHVHRLAIVNNEDITQGLISIEAKSDHVFMHLIESAPFNIGKDKVYLGVAGNLVAYACQVAFQNGFGGCVSFFAKTALMEHYQNTLGAQTLGASQAMVIYTPAALKLVQHYF